MKPYLITGPESLLKAAHSEAQASGVVKILCNCGFTDYQALVINSEGNFWLTFALPTTPSANLTLPADWDKFMGILAELKKPKLPDYARGGISGKHFKVHGDEERAYRVYDVFGKNQLLTKECATPITEQEFIDGGLKELAEAGYVKGAGVMFETTDPSCKGAKGIDSVSFYDGHGSSHSVDRQFKENGFVFKVVSGCHAMPVSNSTLIPTLPTTSQGIPYQRKGCQVFYGAGDNEGVLTVGNLRHLLKQGVTELVTKAGRLTQTDLELLTQ